MTAKKLMLALAAAAALGGCIKIDKTPPKDLPAFVKLYPGSTQIMNMSMAGVTADAFTTLDPPDKVMSFYRDRAAADGLAEGQAPAQPTASAGQVQAAFSDAATGRMLAVVAKPAQGGAGTMVSLTWKAPAPARAGS
jgi:hypothetical protein